MANDAFDLLVRPAEGTRLRVYDDATGHDIVPGYQVKGHPTVGIGRALDVKGISEEEQEYLYQNDKKAIRDNLMGALGWFKDIDPVRQAIMESMAFQMGIEGFMAFKQTLSYIKAGNWDNAADGMLKSLWAKQTPARAEMLAEVMRTGKIKPS